MSSFKGSQESEEYEEVPLVDALNGYLSADGGSGKIFKLPFDSISAPSIKFKLSQISRGLFFYV